ncbi:MAG: T9SS type A sorting domain-containing protein [Bacteroidota bacterium]
MMIRRALAVLAACFSFSGAFAQVITTGTISPTTYCGGASITVPFTSVGTYGAGNVYTAELSNSSGMFPGTTLGTLSSSANSGSIAGTVPFSTTAGTTYKVRVTSSSPASTSIQASQTLTINTQGINAPTFTGTSFCEGATINVAFTVTNGCAFPNTPSNNIFTAELSDNLGSFASPTAIGTLTSNTSGTIVSTIPSAAPGGTAYRIRVKSSNGAIVSPSNASALTINTPGINAPTFTGTSFCQGATINVAFTVTNGCAFPNTPSNNIFTAELSDNLGSFASPTAIGTLTSNTSGTIVSTIPSAAAGGTAYRIRVKSSNGAIVSPSNASALTINTPGINAPTFTGTSFCQGATINVAFTVTNGCAFPNTPSNNIFTAELSDNLGSFASPTAIGTLTSNTSGTIVSTIPSAAAGGTAYRIRVTSSNGAAVSPSNASALTINTPGINAPTFTGTSFCQGATINVAFTVTNGCAFPNTPSNNIFTAELSDNLGSFASPTAIGTLTSNTSGTIVSSIPFTTTGGNGYHIRVKSSNGAIISPSNASGSLTITVVTLNAPTSGASTYCAGASFNVQNTLTNPSCPFTSGNVFTAQLSDASGSFASPLTIGTSTATTAGNIPVTIPTNQPAGTGYRFRVLASTPAITSPISTTNITINQFGINAPTVSATTLCQGAAVNVTYTIQNSCTFPNTPSNNVFTAQLSDASGSFASPINIGSTTSNTGTTFQAVIPTTTPAGAGYRIRVESSNPSILVSPDNGSNITVTATSGTPTVFGTTAWNAYVYSGTVFPLTSDLYLGTYTENNLSFNTTSRWVAANGPGTADNTTGSAYAGCAVPVTNYSVSFKRTNFTCGYYQIDMPTHDDDIRVYLDGTLIFSHVGGCCDSHTNIYTGFLGPASQLDFQLINFGGPGDLHVTFSTAVNPVVATPTSTTICSTATATLSATGTAGMTFAWTPLTGLTPSNGLGASVTAQPPSTTTYTVTGTDPTTSCTQTKTSVVNVVGTTTVPTITVTNSSPTICSPVTTSTLTASGANTYTWTPTTGLTPSSGIGSSVVANPTSTTTYTVTGDTGCKTNTQTATVTVQTVPSTPTTTFGSNVWNVFAHNNMTFSNYYGFYQENSLSFNTTSKWNPNTGPSVSNAAYSGCTFGGTQYSLSFKRTDFTCGYYQLDVNYQDDSFTLLVNGVQVFQNNNVTNTVQTNVWSGFLGPSSTVELRLINNTGPGQLQFAMAPAANGPQTLSPNVTICAGTNTNLTATAAAYPSATYSWAVSPSTPDITFNPGANQANTQLQTAGATAGGNYILTNTITDAGSGNTGCTATKSITVTVDPLPTTAVTPTSATVICPTQIVTLTATGANTYTWSPAAGLSATTGNVVTAQPTTTTTYTVVGDNNCSTNSAQSVITVIPLPDYATVYPTNTWNVYGFNSTTYGTNYQGFYTENGTGSPSYSFNSTTRYGATSAPSTVNTTSGNAWQGCTMPATNYVLSAKRTGFACGTYTIDIPSHDDYFSLYINGTKVAEHLGCCDSHTNVWTGVLTTTSTIDYEMTNFGGNGFFSITLTQLAQPAGQTTWIGATSTDWFTASNWCNAVPTATTDALITAAGAIYQPTIGATGAAVRNITINGAVAASGASLAVPAASLTMGAFNLDVNGNWTSNGTLTAGTGSVSFVGSGANATIAGSSAFNNIIINKANGVTINASTTQQVNGSMTFTNGIVTQNGTLKFNAGSLASGANNSSYVDGIVTKTGNTTFTFPLGKAGLFHPINISSPATATDTYTAQYFNSSGLSGRPNANRAVTLDHVSSLEYWNLVRSTGSGSVRVLLGWNSNSMVDDLTPLRVANWNGSFWADLGNALTTGTTTMGTITDLTNSTQGAYTFASANENNGLPVIMTDFDCGLNSFGAPKIAWTTTAEMNSDHFAIERSADGKNFETVSRILAKGYSTSEQKYSFEDDDAPNGHLYYRLKEVDRDGLIVSYEVCAMTVESVGWTIYPNPATGTATIRLNGGTLMELTVINTVGQSVKVPFAVKGPGVEIDVSSLPAGVYLIRVSTGNRSEILRLLKS